MGGSKYMGVGRARGSFFVKVENTFAKEPQRCPAQEKENKEQRSNMLASRKESDDFSEANAFDIFS